MIDDERAIEVRGTAVEGTEAAATTPGDAGAAGAGEPGAPTDGAVAAEDPGPAAAPGEPEHHPVPGWVADADPVDLVPALEAVCHALNRPLTLAEAAAILGRSTAAVRAAADLLGEELRRRGLMLQRHQEHIQLVTRPETAWAVQRALHPERPARLSRAALETLAIVAYRQPVTRAAIEAIRGVGCEAVLESLERRDLIVEVGRGDGPGQPRLFGTTLRFLQVTGLERIEQLPPLGAGGLSGLEAFGLDTGSPGGGGDGGDDDADGEAPE